MRILIKNSYTQDKGKKTQRHPETRSLVNIRVKNFEAIAYAVAEVSNNNFFHS